MWSHSSYPSNLKAFASAFAPWMLQLQLSSLSNHSSVLKRYPSDKQWKSVTLENVGRGMQNVRCTYTNSGGKPYSQWVRLQTQKHPYTQTHTHTYMWGLWVTKVRMRRSDERKSENVRSVDIEHEPTTEGLACVGGDVKRPHVCAALHFDRSGTSFLPHSSLRPAAEARSRFITHTQIFIGAWKNQVATHTYIVKDKTKKTNTQKWLNGHTDHSSHRSTWFPQSMY